MLTGTLAQIDSFGAVGAEDDETLLDYFLSTPAVNQIESGRKMLVLGRKGSGKTALVRYFGNKTSDDDIHISLRLGQYPWNVHAQRKNSGASDIEVYSSSWRYLIAVKTLSAILGRYRKVLMSAEAAIAREFLMANEALYGYSVVGYRRGLPSGGTEWIFSYTNPQLKFDPLATQIKIHIGLKEYFGLSEKTGD